MSPGYSSTTAPCTGYATTLVTITSGTSGTITISSDEWGMRTFSYTSTAISNWPPQINFLAPAWERWFDAWRMPVRPLLPNKRAMQQAMRRAASRQCIKDARRWKRRRFVQRLRAESNQEGP